MDARIVIAAALLLVTAGAASAQQPLVAIETDSQQYEEGDIIVVSGTVNTIFEDTPVLLSIYIDDTLIDVEQITVAQDGRFSKSFKTGDADENSVWKRAGEYTISAAYHDDIITTIISYSLKTDIPEIIGNYEVRAGDRGTFDVPYSIRGGDIQEMAVEYDMLALDITIRAPERDGTMTLNIGRDYMGAEKQDGADEAFIVLIDGVYVEHREIATHSDTRLIEIDFVKDSSKVTVIGTYIIPEFGVMAAVVLAAGVVSVIAAARYAPMFRTA